MVILLEPLAGEEVMRVVGGVGGVVAAAPSAPGGHDRVKGSHSSILVCH